MNANARACKQKFLRFFPKGFADPKYIDWERGYKETAHERWVATLDRAEYARLLEAGAYADIAARAVRLESQTNLLFSFEKMALRDAVKPASGARAFAEGLFELVYGRAGLQSRFEAWVEVVRELPRVQTRVLTWPVATVFGFIARPAEQIFLKPNVTRIAAREYGFDFHYLSTVAWDTYASYLGFAEQIREDLASMKPRDMIDIQSFMWVQGSDEYEE
ncbi:MAG: hypothetical protein M3081_10535 [Gemmatimonadota bacterium]|nr:hypothetical protein [Gemmatimonadota bacterium]